MMYKIQKIKFDLAEKRTFKMPNYLGRRLHELALLCEREKRGDFYFAVVRLVSDYVPFMTGLDVAY